MRFILHSFYFLSFSSISMKEKRKPLFRCGFLFMFFVFSVFQLLPVGIVSHCRYKGLAVIGSVIRRNQIIVITLRDLDVFTLVDDVEHCLSGRISTVGVAEGAEEAVAVHVCVHVVDNQCACGVAADVGVREEAAEIIDRVAVSVRVNYGPGDAGALSCICYECCGFTDEVVFV